MRVQSLATYLRAEAWRRIDRVEQRDQGRNARCALALLDAAVYVEGLRDDDPHIAMLDRRGCFGPFGADAFDPGPEGARLIRSWQGGEPRELLDALVPAVARARS
jgi:hypothetical protein